MHELDFDDLLELLVEDELSADQRREMLSRLDESPGQWRRVGLAFMEQQQIRQSIKQIYREPSEATHAISLKADTTEKKVRVSWSRVLALVACLMAVFSIGLASGYRTGSKVIADVPVQTISQPPTLASDASDATQSASPATVVTNRVMEEGIVGYVSWDTSVGVRLSPVFVGNADEGWLEKNPPKVNQNLQRALSRAGWQIRPARRLVSMQLETGDQFTIPMDDLTYHYVGRQVF